MNVKEDLRLKYPDKNFAPEDLPFGAMLQEQLELLQEVDSFVSTMRVTGRQNMLPFQEGIVMGCRALPILHKFLTETFPDTKIEICTTHLNQDCLEQLFALIRMLGGHIGNPTPPEVTRRLRNVLLGNQPELVLDRRAVNVAVEQSVESCQILNSEV